MRRIGLTSKTHVIDAPGSWPYKDQLQFNSSFSFAAFQIFSKQMDLKLASLSNTPEREMNCSRHHGFHPSVVALNKLGLKGRVRQAWTLSTL